MEYEAVRGVNISKERAEALGRAASENGVLLSLHAPYYINLASEKQQTREASVRRLAEAVEASDWMGSYAVVFHPGYYGAFTRTEALKMVVKGVEEVSKIVSGRSSWLAPETTGKTKQIGSVEEIIAICSSVDRCRPTIDWAHLYARSGGKFPSSPSDVLRTIDLIERELGREAVRPLHTHFSKIEHGRGGEKRHLVMSDEGGPDFGAVCSAYSEAGIDAVVISESPLLERDAIVMREMCARACEG